MKANMCGVMNIRFVGTANELTDYLKALWGDDEYEMVENPETGEMH